MQWSESNRNVSMRIPLNVVKARKGYVEDRRPASNMDPYKVIANILNTINM